MNSKYEKMIENLKSLGSVAVAFSGGVDSTFLLKAAKEALGNNALAVTVFAKRRNFAKVKIYVILYVMLTRLI